MSGNSSMPMPTYGPIQGPYSGTSALVISALFIAICTTIVGLRLSARYLSKTRWGWDDYLLIPSLLVSLLVFSTFIYMIVNCGGGYHEQYVFMSDPSKLVMFAKLTVLNTVALLIALALPRCCILVTYLRFFTNKKLRILTWTLLGMTISYAIIATIVNVTVCIPLDTLWDPTVKGVCINESAWWGFGTVPVAVFDILTMALPISTIRQLQRPFHERMGLLGVFLAYGIGTIAEITRIVTFNKINGTADVTWSFVPLAIVSVCEVSAYLIASCIPGLRPLWLHLKGRGPMSQQSTGLKNNANNSKYSGGTPLWRSHKLESFTTKQVPDGSSQHSYMSNEIKVTQDFIVE